MSKAGKKANGSTDQLDEDLHNYVETVRHLVRLGDVLAEALEDGDPIQVDVRRFQVLRNIAIGEVLLATTRAEQAEAAGISPSTVEKWVRTPLYARIREVVNDRAKQVALSGTMLSVAEELEGVFTLEMLHEALRGTGRDRLKALDEFTGRRSAKKGREASVTLRLPPQLEEAIMQAREIQLRHALPEETEVIDATVIRRPDDA